MTAALDIAYQIEVLSLIRTLSRDKGLSVLIVLHDITMAARFCDRIYALKQGAVAASGNPGARVRRDTLRDIDGIAMDVIPPPGVSIPLADVCRTLPVSADVATDSAHGRHPAAADGLRGPCLGREAGGRQAPSATADTLMLLADLVGRTGIFSYRFPAGQVSALVGAPFLMLKLRRKA